jgi:hypothetical protein
VLLALGEEGASLNALYSDTSQHRKIAEEFTGWDPASCSVPDLDGESRLGYWARSLLSKYPLLQSGINTRAVAMETWARAEDACRATNHKLASRRWQSEPEYSWDREVLKVAGDYCRSVLGDFSWDSAYLHCDYGPGASIGVPSVRRALRYKIGAKKPTATGTCESLYAAYLRYNERLARFTEQHDVRPEWVDGNRVTTVPKSAKTDRVIAIEPLLNMFFQKGIGGLMRLRLLRFGCNLNDQSVNRALALEGSKNGLVATLDLSSASDTVSRGLVQTLIPEDWLVAMNTVRSAHSVLDGERYFLQKYSSMGNGFTFELESLIFLSIAQAIRKLAFPAIKSHQISVYGDDIIVPVEMATTLANSLAACGFTVNSKKSYWHGSFRESCGMHGFGGADVTPVYIKSKVDCPERSLWLLNSVRRLAHRSLGTGYGCDSRFREAWELIFSSLPLRFRQLSIPEGFGDGGVLRDFDDVCPRPHRPKGWVEGYYAKSVSREYPYDHPTGEEVLLASLWRLERQKSVGVVAGKGWPSEELNLRRHRDRFHKILVPQWGALGPWL